MLRSSSSVQSRRGITLVEVLVIVGILALLAAILLPAVQAAREAGRRAQCLSNLHQIGIAVQEYIDANGIFPPSTCESAILPQLDLLSVYRQINYSARWTDTTNATARGVRVAVYHCPSDAVAWRSQGTNYAGNFGSGVQAFGYNGVIRPLHGLYLAGEEASDTYVISPASVTDGLSSTALAAEILSATEEPRDARRAIWNVPIPLTLPSQLDAFANECDAVFGPVPWPSQRGASWLAPDLSETGYNHILVPNRKSCMNGDVQRGAYTANSLHPGGVNLLRADGHAGFVSDNIERIIWRAIGSRNGREALAF